jgi:hypothetical protein
MGLWQDFQSNDGKPIHKWNHYFPIYERHFSPWRDLPLTFIEIGVEGGGSLQMWRRYFGPKATIIGLDINPACATHDGEGVAVRIGDQSDPTFLQSVIDEFGAPDVVLDDGSHIMAHIKASFEFLYPRLSPKGVYMVEDLHTAYWPQYGGGLEQPDSFVNIARDLTNQLNAAYALGAVEPDFHTRHTLGISFYDSMVVLERGEILERVSERVGRNGKTREVWGQPGVQTIPR